MWGVLAIIPAVQVALDLVADSTAAATVAPRRLEDQVPTLAVAVEALLTFDGAVQHWRIASSSPVEVAVEDTDSVVVTVETVEVRQAPTAQPTVEAPTMV